MIKKFQSCCLSHITNPLDIVTLQVMEQPEKDVEYRVILDEISPGTFTLNTEEGCIYAKEFCM